MRSQHLPLVSVALCTYNGQAFLEKQLDSILSQDYDCLEVIVADDFSTDGTTDILAKYQAKDHRVRIFRNEKNLGYTRNFEKALEQCKGQYIAFADQDDIWEPNKISTCVKNIQGHIMVYHNSDYIDEHDRPIRGETVASIFKVYEGKSCLPFILSNCVHGHAVLFDSKLKSYLTPFNPKFSHDWWLAYVAFNIGSVKYLDKVLVHYRQHKNSITDTFNLRGYTPTPRKVKGLDRITIDLDQLKHCSEFKYNREDGLVKKAYQLFSNLAKGQDRLKSFWFMVRYFDPLFYIYARHRARGFFSKINWIRKICFD